MKNSASRNKIMSVSFSCDEKSKILKELNTRIENKCSTTIFTPNSEMLLKAHYSPQLQALLGQSDINLPDGIGVILASKLLKKNIRHRNSGIDFAQSLLELATQKGYSVFLLGGKRGVAQKAEQKLKLLYPNLYICGTHNGYFSKVGEENNAVLKKINSAKPSILFVCFGFPLQEEWIIKNIKHLPCVSVAIGLGGSLDVWSGNTKRAPIAFQKLGFEWLWRMINEPKRSKIIFEIPHFIFCALKQK